MLSKALVSLCTLALGVAAVPSPTLEVRQSNLGACAAGLNGALPSPTPANFHWNGVVRRFYVAAEEVEWNYAPTGWDNWLGVPLNLSPRAKWAGALEYGTVWLKALYRGYTDASFSQQTPQPPWQGTLGPTLRAEVGDLIEIMFVNKLSKNYATMHSMGLMYTKVSEGGDYPNNTYPGQNVVLAEQNAVPPGGCVVYKWMVDDQSGPPPYEPARGHSYHSYVALQQDTNAGLIGPSIIYAAGQMNATMAKYREFPLLYMIYSEMESFLSNQNAARLKGKGNQNIPREAAGPPGGSGGFGGNAGGQGGQGGAPTGGFGGQPTGGFGGAPSGAPAASAAPSAAAPSGGAPSGGAPSGAPSGGAPSGAPSGSSGSGGAPSGFGSGSFGGSDGFGPFASGQPNLDPNNLYPGNYSVWHPQLVNLATSEQFMMAPSFYSMNGYIFSNNPIFEMCLNDDVIWYTMAYGSASHVFHMHGNGFAYLNNTYPSISLAPGVMRTLYMNATGAGLWQVICHVNMHQTLGMEANYNVSYAGQCPIPPVGQLSAAT